MQEEGRSSSSGGALLQRSEEELGEGELPGRQPETLRVTPAHPDQAADDLPGAAGLPVGGAAKARSHAHLPLVAMGVFMGEALFARYSLNSTGSRAVPQGGGSNAGSVP